MQNKVFRKKSLDRISSPEQLNDYIRVTNPGVWLTMSAVIFLLLGVIIWGIFGRLDTTVSVGAITENDQTVCFVKEDEAAALDEKMLVKIEENTYSIRSISLQPVQVDESFVDYLVHVGNLAEGEWVYIIALDGCHGENGSIFEADIIVESIAPMHFVTN